MDEWKRCPDCAEQIRQEARKCRYCGYEFAVSAQRPASRVQTSADKQNQGCGLAVILVGIILLIGWCGSKNNTPPVSTSTNAVENVASTRAADPYSVRLQREVDDLQKNPTLTSLPTTKDEMLMALVLIGGRIKIYQDAPSNLTKQDEKVRAEFRRLQAAYQRNAFPKLRKAQAEILDKLLWEQDVRVNAVGDGNRILKFTGAIFASNRGVKVAQENMGETVEMLRFKEVRYEWYSGSEYQYYRYKPVGDAVLADFTDANRWVPIQ